MCFSGRSEKQDGRPGLWLAETFSTSPLKPLNGIQRNLTGSKILASSTKFVFFGPIEKKRWPPWPLIGWDIFDFSSETAEQNSTKLDRKQDLNVLYQVCVFWADRKKKMAALASDWLRHFRLLLWNRWTEFNETWQEARSHCPLPSLCFLGRLEKKDGRPGLWLAETFWTSPLKPLNGIQRNLTGSKISTSSTMFVFFGPIRKTRWPPWPLIGWGIFDFSSETAERNSMKLDRKQDFNVLYQVSVFWADRINKTAALASDWLIHFRLLLWNLWTEFNKSWQEARSQRPLPSLCFSDRSKKKRMAALDSDWLRHFGLLLWNRWTEFNETWQEARSQRPLPSLCFSGRSENKMAALASDWLRHFRLLLWNRWTEFNKTWQEERSQRPPPSLCFLGRLEKQDGRPGQSVKKVAHCTQVHDMWSFGPLVFSWRFNFAIHVPGANSRRFMFASDLIYVQNACNLNICAILYLRDNRLHDYHEIKRWWIKDKDIYSCISAPFTKFSSSPTNSPNSTGPFKRICSGSMSSPTSPE